MTIVNGCILFSLKYLGFNFLYLAQNNQSIVTKEKNNNHNSSSFETSSYLSTKKIFKLCDGKRKKEGIHQNEHYFFYIEPKKLCFSIVQMILEKRIYIRQL